MLSLSDIACLLNLVTVLDFTERGFIDFMEFFFKYCILLGFIGSLI